MGNTVLITNADAGSHDDDAVSAAVQVLREAGTVVDIIATRNTGELKTLLADLRGRDVVIAGGDGSVHAVIEGLWRQRLLDDVTVGLIPLGTGNDFARGIGLPLDAAEAAAVIVAGRRASLDLLTDEGDGVVVNAVHVGIGAEAGREAEPWKPRLGKLGYLVGAVIAGVSTDGHRLRVVADGAVLADGRRRVLQVGVGNGAFIGGGTELTPTADPADGLADVLVSFAVSPWQRLLYGVHLKRGTHQQRHDVRTVTAQQVTITGDEFWCNADGELSGPVRSRTWTVQSGAVTIMLPAQSSRRDG